MMANSQQEMAISDAHVAQVRNIIEQTNQATSKLNGINFMPSATNPKFNFNALPIRNPVNFVPTKAGTPAARALLAA